MITYSIGSHVEYTITVLKDGKFKAEYKGTPGDWYEVVGEGRKLPVFFNSTSLELDAALATYKDNY